MFIVIIIYTLIDVFGHNQVSGIYRQEILVQFKKSYQSTVPGTYI